VLPTPGMEVGPKVRTVVLNVPSCLGVTRFKYCQLTKFRLKMVFKLAPFTCRYPGSHLLEKLIQ
jgi:hypothetical protein